MNDPQEEQIVYMSPGGSVPVPQKSDRADMIDKIKPEALVETIRHRLLGEELIDSTWVPVQALKKFALTPRGAWDISNLMLGVSSINTTVSKIKEEVIKQRLRRIARDCQLMLVAHWREYGIKNTAQMHFVHNIVFTNAMMVLFQAGDGSIQELLKGTVTENRNINSERKEPGKWRRLLGL
jgi:hypothetical protein